MDRKQISKQETEKSKIRGWSNCGLKSFSKTNIWWEEWVSWLPTCWSQILGKVWHNLTLPLKWIKFLLANQIPLLENDDSHTSTGIFRRSAAGAVQICLVHAVFGVLVVVSQIKWQQPSKPKLLSLLFTPDCTSSATPSPVHCTQVKPVWTGSCRRIFCNSFANLTMIWYIHEVTKSYCWCCWSMVTAPIVFKICC